jgi:DivIVA domain-containing protein
VTSKDEQDFPYYRSPAAIRGETFSRRMRGLDESEVDEYLNLLADQVQAMEIERRGLQEQVENLEADNERLRTGEGRTRTEVSQMRERLAEYEQVGDRANDQVVEMFSQAQLIAEEMVEDARQDTRQRLGQARAQERQILEEAMQSAERTLRDAEAMVARAAGTGTGTGLPATPFGGHRAAAQAHPGGEVAAVTAELEQVRSFAREAQAQMQSIMDAFATEVSRMGGSSPTNGTPAGRPVEAPRNDADGWGPA